ncbi:MAG: glycosyltransferase family 39 protein [Candidatus Neomarinimicrobiota bacterium]
MKYIDKNAMKISYSPYEIMLFVTIWTYGIFGAFLTRSDNYLILIFGSFVPILLSYILLTIDHHENKKTLEIEFDSLKIVSIFFISMLILINDGLFSWFYNDQSAHVTETFKHGILLGTMLPGIEDFSYKILIHITNILVLIFFISVIIFLRNQKNIYVKIFLVTIIFLFLRSIIIYFGGTQSIHPPLRLFPIFVSSTFFGINEFGIRIVQLILASSFLTYFFTILKKHFSNLNSILFTTLILTTPLFLFTSLSIEPSIYAFIIVTIFLIDIYNHLEGQKFSFSKWIFIISIGSLIRQSIFLLFIPLFMAYLLQKEWNIKSVNIKSVGKLLSPFFVCLPIFLNSLLSGTPSTNNLQMNGFLDNNYLEIFVSNFGILLSLFIIISLIPNLKKLKSSFILTTTFLILFYSFIIVPFYGYEFTYRYHAEYALPFAFLGLYRTCLYLVKLSYNRLITGILLLSIITNITIYLPVFLPKKISFQSLLANNFSNYKNVYSFIVKENYENQFYYIGPNQRLISKIMYGLSIKNSINSTNPEHFNIETFATNLDFENIDEIIRNYNIIIIDTFETNIQNHDVSPYDVSPYTVDINKHNNYKNTVLYDINKHNKIIKYLESIPFEEKKIFNGSMGFKTLIFINEKN